MCCLSRHSDNRVRTRVKCSFIHSLSLVRQETIMSKSSNVNGTKARHNRSSSSALTYLSLLSTLHKKRNHKTRPQVRSKITEAVATTNQSTHGRTRENIFLEDPHISREQLRRVSHNLLRECGERKRAVGENFPNFLQCRLFKPRYKKLL